MTKLVWDDTGKRTYEAGLDHGVLYLANGSGVAWNGLVSITEDLGSVDAEAVYFDGRKHIDAKSYGEFSATLNAFTYPDEFLEYSGFAQLENGLFAANQGAKEFGLSYRVLLGNDINGIDAGYKIHLLYNLIATPAMTSYISTSNTNDPNVFSWAITSIPEKVPGYRATAHAVIDSRYLETSLLEEVENTIYGTSTLSPNLPSLTEFVELLTSDFLIRIVDHGDGTWSAIGPGANVSMTSATEFQVVGVDGSYSDADTYTISSTE